MNSLKIGATLFGLLGTIALFSTPSLAAPVKPQISVSNAIVTEGHSGTTAAAFTVTLSASTTVPVNVAYATSNVTAVAPNDYNTLGNTLTFAPGETAKTVNVAVKGDTIDEVNETFNFNLSNPTNATINDALGIGTITDDDDPPVVSVGSASVSEGNSGTKTLLFTISLSATSSRTVAVSAKTVASVVSETNSPAIAGTDYVALPATSISFAPGERSKTVGVTVNGDTLDEDNETFNLLLSSPGNATLGSATGIGTITDDDVTPTISVNDVTVTEGDTGTKTVSFIVSLSAASARSVKITTSTTDGTAKAGEDYIALASNILTFSPGQTSKTVIATINNDTIYEVNETFSLKLSAPVNTVIFDGTGVCTITENDGPPSISASAAYMSEGDSGEKPLQVWLRLSGICGRDVTVKAQTIVASVSPATAGVDYVALPSTTITIPAGSREQTFNVMVKGDLIPEPEERVAVTLSLPVNATLATPKVEGVIQDNDAVPSLSINDLSYVEGNSGTRWYDFTITQSIPTDKTVTVKVKSTDGSLNSATAGVDYVTVPEKTITFQPYQTTSSVQFTVNGDLDNEPDETFNMVLSGATNATIGDGTGVMTIVNNDDGKPLLKVDEFTRVTEGSGGTKNAKITVTLSSPLSVPVTADYYTFDGYQTDYTPANDGTLDYTSTPDYTAQTGTITFAPGQTSKEINIPLNTDTTIEEDEAFYVVFTKTTGAKFADSQTIVVIENDDTDPLPALSVAPEFDIQEGDSGYSKIKIPVRLSKPSVAPVTINYETDGGTSANSFVPLKGVLTFAPGETTKEIEFSAIGDTVIEGYSPVMLLFYAPRNAVPYSLFTIINIIDDDTVPTLSIDSPTIDEGNSGESTLTFTVSMSSKRGKTVTARFNTVPIPTTETEQDGRFVSFYPAKAGEDYVPVTNATVSFAPGELSKTVSVTIKGDVIGELDEKFRGVLSNLVNATIGEGIGLATIKNDDPINEVPMLSFDQSREVIEGDSGTKTENVVLQLSSPAGYPITLYYDTHDLGDQGPQFPMATGGEDFVAIPSTLLTFAPGETTKTIPVVIKGDTSVEKDEFFRLSIYNVFGTFPQGSSDGTVFVIKDDDTLPTLSVDSPQVSENQAVNTGSTTMNFTVTLSKPWKKTVLASFATATYVQDRLETDYYVTYPATAGQDYVAVPKTVLSFAPGETTKVIPVTIKNDDMFEFVEKLSGVLTGPINATLSEPAGTGIILDDDINKASSISISAPEFVVEGDSGTRSVVFTVSLNKPTGAPVRANFGTVDITATGGVDYAGISGSLLFVPGETTKTISIAVNGDTIMEQNEQFRLVLGNITGVPTTSSTLSRDVTIQNDDNFSARSASVSSGSS